MNDTLASAKGSVRVGTKKGQTLPSYEGYKRVVCLMPSSAYGSISPYMLQDEKGRILENVWQFSKVYEKIPRSVQRYSRYDKRIIWDHAAETHVEDGVVNAAYFSWRQKGMNHNEAVRYPVGLKHRSKCLYAYKEDGNGGVDTNTPLGYVEARKEIYLPIYIDAVRKTEEFQKLKRRLSKGENLLVIEVDGPHEESLEYYMESYGVSADFIEHDTMLVTPEAIELMLNDERHNFGHGYCLAMALLDIDWLS